jgi:hypothetical protein
MFMKYALYTSMCDMFTNIKCMCHMTNKATKLNRVRLEKLIVARLVKKFPAFYGT